jgi:WD40 repeat protein
LSYAQRTDRLGDPLPEGAIARLGTTRLRMMEDSLSLVALAFSPDGKRLATASGNARTGQIWDTATGKEVQRFPVNRTWTLAFSPDGKWLVTGDLHGGVQLHDLVGKTPIRKFDLQGNTPSPMHRISMYPDLARGGACFVGFSRDGKEVLAGSSLNTVCVWEVATGKELRRQEGPQKGVYALKFSADGKLAALLESDTRRIGIVEAGTKDQIRPFPGSQSPFPPIAFSPDGNLILTQGDGGMLFLSEIATGKVLRKFRGATPELSSLTFSANGQWVAGGGSGEAVVWEVSSEKEVQRIKGQTRGRAAHFSPPTVAFSPDGTVLAVCGIDGVVQLRRVASGENACPLPGHRGCVERLAFSADGKTLVSVGDDNTVCVFEPESGKELSKLKLPAHDREILAISPGGKAVAWVSQDGSLHLSESNSGKDISSFTGAKKPLVPAACFSPDGKRLAMWDHDSILRLLTLDTGREFYQIHVPERITAASFSFDGEMLATADRKGEFQFWRPATGRGFRKCDGPAVEDGSLIFSPDSRTILSYSNGAKLLLWEVATGRTRWRRWVNAQAAAFTPDGKRIVIVSDQKFFLLDAITGEKLHEWQGHQGLVRCLAISPNGKLLVSGSTDSTILVWEMQALRSKLPLAGKKLSETELEDRWADLASPEAACGNLGITALSNAPKQALPLFAKHLRPAADPEQILQLIADLSSPRFAVRQKAFMELQYLEEAAEGPLRRMLAEQPSLELRRRVEALLQEIDEKPPDLTLLRALRAVEVLERIGGPDATKLLATLASGAAEARLTREAKATLKRLPSR